MDHGHGAGRQRTGARAVVLRERHDRIESEQLSEHTTPYDALVRVVDGEAEITIAGKPHRLRAGDMIVMPADQPHAVAAVSRLKMLLTMIRS